MKNKNLIIILVSALVITSLVLIARTRIPKKPAVKPSPAAKEVKKPKAAEAKKSSLPAKKVISKGKGALIVKILDSKKREMSLRIRAFRTIDARSSTYASSFTANRPQELSPGTYDIEIDTVPQRIYKNVTVREGRENTEDIGSITGSINVRALNAKREDGNYRVRVAYSKSNDLAGVTTTNKVFEILPGVYDVEIGTSPRQFKKDVRIDAGRETVLDLGCTTGLLAVKAVSEDRKEVRYGIRITKSENNELIATGSTDRPTELLQGVYNIEVSSAPKQEKRGVKVTAGEETNVEFIVQPPQAVPAKAKK